MSLAHTISFFRRYIAAPDVVGAVAPSSRGLARALAEPFAQRDRPASVLEVGAGTGAVTRGIAAQFGSQDRLDIYEIEPSFADTIEKDLLSVDPLATGLREGRVRLVRAPIQSLDAVDRYDYVISGLPFTIFSMEDLEAIFDVIRRALKPGGTMSYFEYMAVRRLTTLAPMRASTRKRRIVSDHLSGQIDRFQFDRRLVWLNLPPACARHLRFDPRPVLDS